VLLGRGWSGFTSTLYRKLDAEWLFLQEKATFDAAVVSTSEVKPLLALERSCFAPRFVLRLMAG
jgi:hypothetical protein